MPEKSPLVRIPQQDHGIRRRIRIRMRRSGGEEIAIAISSLKSKHRGTKTSLSRDRRSKNTLCIKGMVDSLIITMGLPVR